VLSRRLLPYASQIFDIERDLCEILQATRTIMNTFVPSNGLPPEVLSRVLEHRDCDNDLVAATHVCRYWRSTLVSSPLLWTSFRLKSSPDLDRTFTYLERSKSTPIDVKISSRSPKDLEIFKHLAPHITRARSLIIDGSHLDVPAISHLLRSPVPSLQHLQIDSHECPIRLPDDFLGQQALSLRSVNFSGIRLTFESSFPLPNLTEFKLSLPKGAGPIHMSALLRFFSASSQLQKIRINTGHEVLQGIAPDQVVSLESLVEFDCACKPAGRILPCLRLPRLKRLRVYLSLGSGQGPTLADLLPFDGRILIMGTTKMLYCSDTWSHRIELSGKGVYVSLTVSTPGPTSVDWFSDETYVPLGQIEDLTVEGRYGSATADFPINAFKDLGVLRVIPWNEQFAEDFLLLLYPGVVIPCQSLREIRYTYRQPLGPLINLARERKRAGHQLVSVWLLIVRGFDENRAEELREHVGEARLERWDPSR
jgi:hypothetical protein